MIIAATSLSELISVRSLADARREFHAYDGVISIHDSECRDPLIIPPGGTLQHRFSFDDTDVVNGFGVAPAEVQVRDMLLIGRAYVGKRLLVHCHQGQCRSAAAALGIIADRLGQGMEKQAVRALLDIRPSSVCNLLVVAHADRLLRREGALAAAWMEYENGSDKVSGIRLLRRLSVSIESQEHIPT